MRAILASAFRIAALAGVLALPLIAASPAQAQSRGGGGGWHGGGGGWHGGGGGWHGGGGGWHGGGGGWHGGGGGWYGGGGGWYGGFHPGYGPGYGGGCCYRGGVFIGTRSSMHPHPSTTRRLSITRRRPTIRRSTIRPPATSRLVQALSSGSLLKA